MSFLDLVTSENEIKGVNEGFSDYKWDQISATRNVTDTNFPNGLIRFKFDIDATRRWIPKEAYIRMRIKLTDSTGNVQLKISDDVAPSMGFISAMFQNMEFRYNNVAISTLSDYVPEVNSLLVRTMRSKCQIDSMGGMNMWEYDFYRRQNRVCSDGIDRDDYSDTTAITTLAALGFDAANTVNVAATGLVTFAQGAGASVPDMRSVFNPGDSIAVTGTGAGNEIRYGTVKYCPTTLTVQLNETQTAHAGATVLSAISLSRRTPRIAKRDAAIEVIWRPPLSVFDYEKGLPIGKYELQLNPQTSSVYKNLIVQSLTGAKVAGTDFNVSVVDMYLYVPTVKAKRFGSGKFFIDLTEVTCQKDTITNGTGFTHSRFTVPKSTYALTAAFQDSETQTSSLYPSTKFKLRNNDSELNLTRFHIHYAGKVRPSPDADPIYKSTAALPEEYTTEMYYRSAVAVGALDDTGGFEKHREWQDRGAYYHYFWPKDGSNSDTEVRVHYQFSSIAATSDCLLFSWAKKLVEVNVADDSIVAVNVVEG